MATEQDAGRIGDQPQKLKPAALADGAQRLIVSKSRIAQA
ncbi:hypothetical protein MELB17_04032 [Marinobacter sp. ELB17]|nr:hypothetical protein MELB17_04032 [Marinobacter sp. ELB17]